MQIYEVGMFHFVNIAEFSELLIELPVHIVTNNL